MPDGFIFLQHFATPERITRKAFKTDAYENIKQAKVEKL